MIVDAFPDTLLDGGANPPTSINIKRDKIMTKTNLKCHNNRFNQCCCTCLSHIPDHSHPHHDGKPVTNIKGWICYIDLSGDIHASSGWPEHSMGCELYRYNEQ